MRFKEIVSVDEAEILARRSNSVSERNYILYDPEKLTEKYAIAWKNLRLNVTNLTPYKNL